MKYITLCQLVLLVALSSCSNDSSPSQEVPKDDGVATNFYPIKESNYWIYKTENTSVNPNTIGRDSLYIEKEVEINGFTYQKMKTKFLPTGFYCGALENNAIRVDGKMIKLSGDLSVNIVENLPVNFSVNDFVIFKENATSNEEFGKVSGTIVNTTALPGYPLTVNYVLSAKEDGSLTTFKSNGVDYTDVKKVKLVLNLKVFAKTDFLSIDFLSPNNQEVLVSEQYYAKNYGLIKSETKINYTLNPLIDSFTTLEFPLTGSQSSNDYLLSK
ncbi:hypothetical protein [Flavobacterium luteum]|uniref:DUF3823 domain-containing protein n=1 Tax=Flavobacterium luteum TaxID=2026654 RepID=A0A7J5AK83_9FLAO|nr:hypothetical protein [Flavobacterium luteum]KAB1158011.1 hypothetical protein F6464_02710 [Flavobacterium luteum]